MTRSIALVLVLFLTISAAPAAAQIYLELETNFQGEIRGESTFAPEVDRIELIDFQQTSVYSIDPQTGLPTGRVEAKPFVFRKSYDRATVPMLAAFGRNERASRFIIRAYRPDQFGAQEHYLTVELIEGVFAQRTVAASDSDPGIDTWSMAFQGIRWRDEITGVEWLDSYNGTTALTDPLARNETELAPVPNPTSGRTAFSFRLPESGQVTIDVYDLRGRRIASVFDGPVFSTDSIVEWDGSDDFGQPVAQGVYLVKMRSGEWLTTRKLSVVR